MRCEVQPCSLVRGRVLLAVVDADPDDLEGILLCPVDCLLAEHVVDHLIHADAKPEP